MAENKHPNDQDQNQQSGSDNFADDVLKNGLHSPEAAAGENGDLLGAGRVAANDAGDHRRERGKKHADHSALGVRIELRPV